MIRLRLELRLVLSLRLRLGLRLGLRPSTENKSKIQKVTFSLHFLMILISFEILVGVEF